MSLASLNFLVVVSTINDVSHTFLKKKVCMLCSLLCHLVLNRLMAVPLSIPSLIPSHSLTPQPSTSGNPVNLNYPVTHT